jgi:hypothetical protein
MTLVEDKEDPPGAGAEPESGSRGCEDDLQLLGTEAIEQLASGLNRAAITIQELGQNVSEKKGHSAITMPETSWGSAWPEMFPKGTIVTYLMYIVILKFKGLFDI